jgi:thiosulfate reductase cytochrome b subunit
LNFFLDILLLAGFTLIIISGLAIARTIDFSWLNLGGSRYFWRVMHLSSSFIVLALFGVHLGLHWKWVLQRLTFKKVRNVKEN